MHQLNPSTLTHAADDVARPAYDRARVRRGIVHLGVGAFHRAHQAVYTDACLAAGETDWGILGASLRSTTTRDCLAPQDALYTVAVRESDRQDLRVVGALMDVVAAPAQRAELLAAMADPATRIVSLTVSEKGYTADVATGDLIADHPGVVSDLARPDEPSTVLGFLAEALARRREAGTAPFTILSCDNLPDNGKTLRRALTQFAEARDAALGRFVADHVACPSTMVDRIVPATTDDDRAAVARALGLRDAWPVVTEPFSQWVVEDNFPAGRPGWDIGGAEFVPDVEPYERMKLRLLNGAHTAIALVSLLAGKPTVADAMDDATIAAFVDRLWSEVAPTIATSLDTGAYIERLRRRFRNTALDHRVSQIASDTSLKLPQRIVAPLRDLHAQGAPHGSLVFVLAAWMRCCLGRADAGTPIELNDPALAAWSGRPGDPDASTSDVVDAFLAFETVFPQDAVTRSLRAPLIGALDDIASKGVLGAALARLAGG